MLLQISIPSFNRYSLLQPLLSALKSQIAERVENSEFCNVVVFDNGSTELAYEALAAQELFNSNNFEYFRHSINIGMEGNILCCFEQAKAEYVWIFGDDDMPAQGLLTSLIDLLNTTKPDMVYLDAEWVDQSNVTETANIRCVPSDWNRSITPMQLAGSAGTSLTFLSSIVIKKSLLISKGVDSRYFEGTHMPQMAWVLSALSQDSKLFESKCHCIVASRGNSGGYKVLDVFARRYPEIIDKYEQYMMLGVVQALRAELLLNYLPGLIYQLKNNSLGRFDSNEKMPDATSLSEYPTYKFIKWMHDNVDASTFRFYCLLSKVAYRLISVFRIRLGRYNPMIYGSDRKP